MTFIAKKKNKKKTVKQSKRQKKLSLNISLSEIELCACSKARGWVYGFLHPI